MKENYLFANWKMNKTLSEAMKFIECLEPHIQGDTPTVAIFPSFPYLGYLKNALSNSKIFVGAQNMFYKEEGAFTGEVSPLMLKDFGIRFVLIGHSERRHIFKEDDELINKKVLAALNHGITPILCVGETIEDREKGNTKKVIEEQVNKGLASVKETNFIIAYEPVWAIGTGINATPEQVVEVHKLIRNLLMEKFQDNVAYMPILYGGSIKKENFESLALQPEIDGGLVGGASLDCEHFKSLFDILKNAKANNR